ncbi:DUF3822 family protein [Tenacibaculum sp. IB213877]|uniref:DUF3822 family protein n=1 Tax=Tenacibaculum sp. IB213877 TaxID=3097351 RepID=UPI002A59F7F0|nr:DUF3822 family protein [Tenacibaculum sp. IB213877]MDY0779263.1 DUF3822 family protein [Tenacibaculum sp. IB213877]
MQRKNKNSSVESHNKKLSIQFSLDGFSFCIEDLASKDIITFTEYPFEKTLSTPELLYDNVLQIFADDKDLQQDFSQITVVHQNNLSTLVPDEFFDKTKLKLYLDFNVKTLSNDHIVFDDLQNLPAKNVYIPFVNINNYLFQNFGEFEYKHHSTLLIDNLLNHSKNNPQKQFFVNVYGSNLDIIVIENEQLLLYNSFSFTTKEDFIYYILFVAEQLQLDPNSFKLVFIGTINKESELYSITYNYVRNIDFIKPKSVFLANTNQFSHHSNFILIS